MALPVRHHFIARPAVPHRVPHENLFKKPSLSPAAPAAFSSVAHPEGRDMAARRYAEAMMGYGLGIGYAAPREVEDAGRPPSRLGRRAVPNPKGARPLRGAASTVLCLRACHEPGALRIVLSVMPNMIVWGNISHGAAT
jgi:hypothetical protein